MTDRRARAKSPSPKWGFGVVVVVVLLLGAWPVTGQELGLAAVRSQFPLDQLVLALSPEGAGTLSQGKIQLSLSASWSNTFVMSSEVEDWVRTRGPGRRPLGGDEVRQIEALYPGRDLYFIDGEYLRWDIRAEYGLSNRLQLTLTTAVLSPGGGFGDSAIESFHDLVNTGNAHRDLFPQDHFQMYLRSKTGSFFANGVSSHTVMGDTTLGLKLRAQSLWHGWLGAVAATVKAPTGDDENFGGSGSWDAQLAGYASRKVGAGFLHVNLAYTSIGGINTPSVLDTNDVWAVAGGYEIWSPHHRVNWLLQTTISTSMFQDATDSNLSDTSYLVFIGARLPMGARDRLMFGLAENIINFDNSADIALHVAYSHTFDLASGN